MTEFGDPPRRVIPHNTTFYVRSDGGDANDGLADSPSRAFRTWQAAVNRVSQFDTAGRTVTIQHGVERYAHTFNEGVIVGPILGGGKLRLLGSPVPGGTNLHVVGADCVMSHCTGIDVEIGQMTLSGSGSAGLVSVRYNSRVFIGDGVIFGRGGNAHIQVHDSAAFVQILNAEYRIVDSADYHILNNGGWVFLEMSRCEMVPGCAFRGGFIRCMNGGVMNTVGSVFETVQMTPATQIGPRFVVDSNGTIQTFGSGLEYFPGTGPGILLSGGQYD